MNLERLSSRNMFLRASLLSKLVSTPSRMPTSIQSAQSHRFMGDYFHLWKCQMTSFFSLRYGELLKNSMRISTNAKSPRPPICAQPVKSPLVRSARHGFCQPVFDSFYFGRLSKKAMSMGEEFRNDVTEPSSLRAWFQLSNFGLRDTPASADFVSEQFFSLDHFSYCVGRQIQQFSGLAWSQ